MEVICSSEMLCFIQTAWPCNSENCFLHCDCCENLRSNTIKCLFLPQSAYYSNFLLLFRLVFTVTNLAIQAFKSTTYPFNAIQFQPLLIVCCTVAMVHAHDPPSPAMHSFNTFTIIPELKRGCLPFSTCVFKISSQMVKVKTYKILHKNYIYCCFHLLVTFWLVCRHCF
jgi:hypothetical protein